MEEFVREYNLEGLLEILAEDGGEKFQCTENKKTYHSAVLWLEWGEEAEIRLKFFGDQLIVSRITLSERGKGTGTKVLEYLKDYAQAKGLGKVVVESVMSKEMVMLCRKCGFVPEPRTVIPLGDFIGGNYEYISSQK